MKRKIKRENFWLNSDFGETVQLMSRIRLCRVPWWFFVVVDIEILIIKKMKTEKQTRKIKTENFWLSFDFGEAVQFMSRLRFCRVPGQL